jgi:hypothetical protein
VSGSQWQEGPGPAGEPYRPNEAFQRVLMAKNALDHRTWPGQG